MNPAKPVAMAQKLEAAGFVVTRIAFAELTARNCWFFDWLVEVREMWEDVSLQE